MVKVTVLASSLVLGFLAACHRSPLSEEQPAPSASVVTLGMAIGACDDDIEACERECDAGSADRCRRLAATYALGRGASRDEPRATALYERSCAMADPPACVFAGQMNEYAHGVPKDDAKAARLYQRACDLKWAAGCYNLAIMYERGTGVARDRAKAGDLYQLACTSGAQPACVKAKEMHEPAGVPLQEGGLSL